MRPDLLNEISLGSVGALLAHTGPLPWAEIFGSANPKSRVLAGALIMSMVENEDALLALVDRAVADGHDGILDVYETAAEFNGSKLPKPIAYLIGKDYDRLLSRYIQAGFDPSARWRDGRSAIEAAEEWGSESTAALMRSFVARKAIQVTLEFASP